MITHGGVVDFLYRLATGRPPHGGAAIFAGENLGLSRFELDGQALRLLAFSEPLRRNVL